MTEITENTSSSWHLFTIFVTICRYGTNERVAVLTKIFPPPYNTFLEEIENNCLQFEIVNFGEILRLFHFLPRLPDVCCCYSCYCLQNKSSVLLLKCVKNLAILFIKRHFGRSKICFLSGYWLS